MTKPRRRTAREASKQRLRLWLSLLRTTRRVETALREELRQTYHSTLPRFDVLATLDRHRNGLRMSELSQKLMVSNGNVTGIIERLVSDGLVERRAVVGDRRATRVRLTQEGVDAFSEMAMQHEVWVDRLLSEIDPETAQFIIDALSRVKEEREAE